MTRRCRVARLKLVAVPSSKRPGALSNRLLSAHEPDEDTVDGASSRRPVRGAARRCSAGAELRGGAMVTQCGKWWGTVLTGFGIVGGAGPPRRLTVLGLWLVLAVSGCDDALTEAKRPADEL